MYQCAARRTWPADVKLIRPFAEEIDIDFRNEIEDISLSLGEKTILQLYHSYQLRLTNLAARLDRLLLTLQATLGCPNSFQMNLSRCVSAKQ